MIRPEASSYCCVRSSSARAPAVLIAVPTAIEEYQKDFSRIIIGSRFRRTLVAGVSNAKKGLTRGDSHLMTSWPEQYLSFDGSQPISFPVALALGLAAPKKSDPATSARPCECVQRKGVQSAGRLDNSLAVCCA